VQVVRSYFPFKFDYSPVFEIVFVHQIYTCTMVSVVVLVLTMLFCGFLMHIVNQLKHLRVLIARLKNVPPEKFERKLIFVVRYHVAIIQYVIWEYCSIDSTKDCVIYRYSQNTAGAFSTMLLFYITLTSVVLSVLCFEILMVDAFADSVRFTLHLLGWLIILLSICYNAQLVLDQVRSRDFFLHIQL